ncbi:MAG TPA: AIR synthase-related protein, partial [Rubrobacteraceae bacterium]|nr:AIR synthase-related protein [Rubrobacteraceae bacterium]
ASEMAAKGGVGIELDAGKVPLREPGMEPWEIVISESQERMLAVVEPEKAALVLETAERYELVAAVVGRVTGHGEMRVLNGDEVIASIPAEYLADAPTYEREVVRPAYLEEAQRLDLEGIPPPEDYNAALLKMLAHPNLCSRRSVYEQYDHEVGADTVVRPGADAAVVRIKGTKLGFAVATDCRGRHCYLDQRGGGAAAVAEAYRNLSCVGAEPVAITDCLNFGSPEKPDAYYQLAECIEGMAEACEVFGTPVVSGNVSLYNETECGAIYPTPTVGMVGIFEDVSRRATPGFKREGDMVVVLGGVPRGRPEGHPFGGSSYLEIVHGKVAGRPMVPDLAAEKQAADLVRGMIRSGLVDTAHDLSGGGELVALAEMALAGGIGFVFTKEKIERFASDKHHLHRILLGEKGASFLVTVPWERWDAFQNAIPGEIGWDQAGETGGDRFVVPGLIDLSLDDLRAAHERDLFERHAPEGGHVG